MSIDYGSPAAEKFLEFTENPTAGRKVIGKGEASAIALAYQHNGIVASNNLRDIIPYVNYL